MLFLSVWLQQPFKNETLLFKLFNIKNEINWYFQCTWLETLCSRNFLRPFEDKDTLFHVEAVSDLTYEFCYCVKISLNQILIKFGHLVQWHHDLFWGEFQRNVNCNHLEQPGDFVQWHYDCLFWESQTTKHHKNPTEYVINRRWCNNY